MLIAHLPSGYIIAHLSRHYSQFGGRKILAVTMTGAVFPDIDMLYFYLIDNQQTHHHFYPTHWPLPYAGLLVLSAALYIVCKAKSCLFLLWFSIAALIHMVLDSIAAPMRWLAPFSDWRLMLVEIPAAQPHWILSFIFHWTFLLEIMICATALFLYVRGRA